MAVNKRREIISVGSKKTGDWLWGDDIYNQWNNETKSALLWIQGKPGSGKSTLCKKILKHLQNQYNLSDDAMLNGAFHNVPPQRRSRFVILASFFYSLRGAKSEINNTHMLQSLLYQLLGQEQRLYPAFREKYRSLRGRSPGSVVWNFDDLYDVFSSMGGFDDFPLTIYLIVDAMDESEQLERHRILSLLRHFCQSESACVIKCVLASRPQEDIKDRFLDLRLSQNFFHLVLEKKNEGDIKKFIEIAMSRVQDAYLAQRTAVTAEFTEMVTYATKDLESKARGVFMWVEIVTRELERLVRHGVSAEEFRTKVETLPDELEPFYARIVEDLMARFEVEGTKQFTLRIREAQRMLMWVTFAERPLSVEEFRDAIAIPDVVGENSRVNIEDHRLFDDIAVGQRMSSICGDLLEIGSTHYSANFSLLHDTNDIVQLLHLTVREFLTNDPRAGKFRMERHREEYDIFLNCISYLRLFAENCPMVDGDIPDYKHIIRYLAKWPLLAYILEFLPQHTKYLDYSSQVLDIGAKLGDFIIDQEGSSSFLILEAWVDDVGLCTYSYSPLQRATNFRFDCMNIAIVEGYPDVVATLLEAETAPAADIRYGHLLYNSCRRGILSLTRFLLLKGVDPESVGEDGNAALQAAINNGFTYIVEILLKYGANANGQGDNGNILQAAINTGSADIIEIVLKYGADANARGDNGSILQAAINNGSIEIIEILLKYGADANAQGERGSILQAAINNSSIEIIEILLKYGADANTRGDNGSILQDAINNGSADIIRLLLKYGADANTQGENGNVLHAAIENGSADIVQLLLQFGADVDAQGNNGTALDAATVKGSEDIIQLLLMYKDYTAKIPVPLYEKDTNLSSDDIGEFDCQGS
jgi:ankyrin repeat protein